MRVSHKPLVFSPLSPERTDSKKITLFLNKEADSEKISFEILPAPPKGINIESKFSGADTQLEAEIIISGIRPYTRPMI